MNYLYSNYFLLQEKNALLSENLFLLLEIYDVWMYLGNNKHSFTEVFIK